MKLYTMNQSEREAFQHNLQSADEIACTLVYEGGWSLLRPKPQVITLCLLTGVFQTISTDTFPSLKNYPVPTDST